MADRDAILTAMGALLVKRPNIQSRDYFSDWRDAEGRKAYNRDTRDNMHALHNGRAMLAAVARCAYIDAPALLDAMRSATGGRLSWDHDGLDYCAGQNYSTEYRHAICATLAQALRAHWHHSEYAASAHYHALVTLGRGIANRWFS